MGMKYLVLVLAVVCSMIASFSAIAQNKKVQFKVDTSLFQNAERIVLVLQTDVKRDSIELDNCRAGLWDLTGTCSGFLVVTDNDVVSSQLLFSIKKLKGDTVLLLRTHRHVCQPIFLSKSSLQYTQILYLTSNYERRKHPRAKPIDNTAPILRGCRGMSGRSIPQEVFEKPWCRVEDDLPGLPAEFEKTPTETWTW